MYFKRIKDLRTDENYTQKTVSVYLNCNIKTYYLYEKGYRDIPSEKVVLLAKLYNVSCDYILDLKNEKGQFCGNFTPICKKLKYLRRKNHFSEEYVAEILLCTIPNYSLYETGQRDIPIDLLITLAKLYNESMDYLLLG